jgi:hypothetical protein
VHIYVWGPTHVSSLGVSCDSVTIIDDATRKTLVYFFRQKSYVFYTFTKWKALVENETGKRLKCLRLRNGGEYCNNEFDDYFSYHGIRREKTVPGTPQENGVGKDEQDNHGACKEYDIACWFSVLVLGICCI